MDLKADIFIVTLPNTIYVKFGTILVLIEEISNTRIKENYDD